MTDLDDAPAGLVDAALAAAVARRNAAGPWPPNLGDADAAVVAGLLLREIKRCLAGRVAQPVARRVDRTAARMFAAGWAAGAAAGAEGAAR